jgi:hypothetical protein
MFSNLLTGEQLETHVICGSTKLLRRQASHAGMKKRDFRRLNKQLRNTERKIKMANGR